MDDVLTFEELRRVQRKERDMDTLQDLDEGFLERARNYLAMKRSDDDVLQNKEYRNARRVLEDVLDMRQRKIVKLAFLAVKSDVQVEHLLAREEPLFAAVEEAIDDYRSDLDGMLDGDAETAELDADVADAPAAAGTESDAADTSTAPEEAEDEGGDTVRDEAAVEEADAVVDAEEREEAADAPAPPGDLDDEEPVRVRLTQDVTAFMGVDLEAYGPFDAGQEAEVPAKNAEVLVEQEKAELLQ